MSSSKGILNYKALHASPDWFLTGFLSGNELSKLVYYTLDVAVVPGLFNCIFMYRLSRGMTFTGGNSCRAEGHRG